jgi:hypothetical protein
MSDIRFPGAFMPTSKASTSTSATKIIPANTLQRKKIIKKYIKKYHRVSIYIGDSSLVVIVLVGFC